jgi:hypothetical protein
MNIPDFNDVPLTTREVMARCRSTAATLFVLLMTLRLYYLNDGYVDAFQYHPICMTIAFVMVLPDVAATFKRMREKGKLSSPVTSDVTKERPLIAAEVLRGELVLRHQLTAFAMEVVAAGGFAAVEYVKITNRQAHLTSPHAVVGALCGVAILCQMVLGTLLRYVFNRGQPVYRTVLRAHKLMSLTIVVTGLMNLVGGFLATPYAQFMIPSSFVRAIVACVAVGIAVAGLLI